MNVKVDAVVSLYSSLEEVFIAVNILYDWAITSPPQ